MDFGTARHLVMKRLIEHEYDPVEKAGPKHVNANCRSTTRRYHVRWTDDGCVQFPERNGSGTEKKHQPGNLFEQEGDPNEFIAIVDASNNNIDEESSPIYVVPRPVIRDYVKRHDGMTRYVNVEWLDRYLEAWKPGLPTH